MSRRRNRNSYSTTRYRYSTASSAVVDFDNVRRLLASLSPLSLLEDRRVFHPERDHRPVGTVSRLSQRRIVPKSLSGGRAYFGDTLRFAVPRKVVMCVRRKERREVLHALKRLGGGASGKHYNRNSEVHC